MQLCWENKSYGMSIWKMHWSCRSWNDFLAVYHITDSKSFYVQQNLHLLSFQMAYFPCDISGRMSLFSAFSLNYCLQFHNSPTKRAFMTSIHKFVECTWMRSWQTWNDNETPLTMRSITGTMKLISAYFKQDELWHNYKCLYLW